MKWNLDHSSTVQDLYRQYYYEALDGAISTIQSRFDQPGCVMYCNLEDLLIKAANQQDFTQEVLKVTEFYGPDLNASNQSARLTTLASQFTGSTDPVTLYEAYQKEVGPCLVKYVK